MFHPHHVVTQGITHCQRRQQICLFACQANDQTTHGFQLLLDPGMAHSLYPTFKVQCIFEWRALGLALMTNSATQKKTTPVKNLV